MNEIEKKEIEEMARDLNSRCTTSCYEHDCYTRCGTYIVCEHFYNKGYRNIKDKVVLDKEAYNALITKLKIKTNEAEWRADQLQALDKDFEVMEKVVKCKDCKWLLEQHYEEDGEKPYVKFVCKLTKRQCRLNDFCSYGEEKI